MEPKKDDWVLFRWKIADWQEAYMDSLNRKHIAILSDRSKAPSDRYWEIADSIREEKRCSGVQLQLRKSTMETDLLSLLRDGVIGFDDLSEFSEGLRERLKYLLES